MHRLLRVTAHRPWPVPDRPWIMRQNWHDLLFMHWPLPPQDLRPLVPAQLELDLYGDQAWIGVVPFWMSGIRKRGLPPMPGLSRFPELNVRTYVRCGKKAGVYFFSLDAANSTAVWAARKFYHLPYFRAEMRAEERGEEIVYSSRRLESSAEYSGRYHPVSDVKLRVKGSLEHFLTERYCLYTISEGEVYCGDIHHPPWPLQDAIANVTKNSMATAVGITLPPAAPLLHFAKRLEILIWPLERV
ncbi:MAG TPA: DUF2071 domain-containing protein [Terriglobales bacterium]|jgi:uncharacterized protein YqjF (DUF2071 family)|nr:DUF2071 domain-containing protein [Terriglobales bacterium]